MKVYELAKELNLTNEEIIEKLQEIGSDVKHHMSVLDDDIIQKIKDNFNDNKELDLLKEKQVLEERLAKMELLINSLTEQKEKTFTIVDNDFEFEEIPEIPMNKVIKVMSLFSGGLNLKTTNDGTAQVFRFEFIGQILPIIYSDLVKIVSNQRAFFEQGYCMILDKDVVKAHYLEDYYKKFIDGRVINNILEYDVDKIKEIFTNTTPVIQQSIIDMMVQKINNNEYVDKNKVTALNEVYGNDIFELANKLK